MLSAVSAGIFGMGVREQRGGDRDHGTHTHTQTPAHPRSIGGVREMDRSIKTQ